MFSRAAPWSSQGWSSPGSFRSAPPRRKPHSAPIRTQPLGGGARSRELTSPLLTPTMQGVRNAASSPFSLHPSLGPLGSVHTSGYPRNVLEHLSAQELLSSPLPVSHMDFHLVLRFSHLLSRLSLFKAGSVPSSSAHYPIFFTVIIFI